MNLKAIVAATDLSAQCAPAARWAHALAEAAGASVVAGHIIELGFDSWWRSKYEVLMDAEKRQQAVDAVTAWYEGAVGAPPTSTSLGVNTCAEGLTEIVLEHEAGLLVMAASSKSGLMKTVVGSRLHALAARPPCPLAIVKADQPFEAGGDVGVATDFSPASEKAIRFAAKLADVLGRPLHVVTVAQKPATPALPGLFDGLAGEAATATRERLDGWLEEILGADHTANVAVLDGDPVYEALSLFSGDAKLGMFVVGQTGHRSVVGDLLGSVPRHLINKLPCTMIVTPQ